ncbi:TonB-dependent receptor [Microbulbifer sp. TYP-18]|uniref:TonB-dependent receptor n=1 Tax=Microbulbifer sp. TYP-18 TaxID=3230024 RepID=UPI0034C68C99
MKKYNGSDEFFPRNRMSVAVAQSVRTLALAATIVPLTQPVLAQNGADTTIEEVQVVGIRGSLESASEIKRDLDVVADVISAEDIGKFPDQNLAESLQRISGVQISRNRGEGQDVSVRGLSPDFTRVQFNGRTLPSATGGRSFDFTILPSDFVSALEVYKTPSADMEEGALSATVNVKTPRPLDIGERSVVTSVKAVREDNSGETTGDISALYSDVFADGEFGITLGAHYDKRSVESHIFEAFGLEPGSEGARAPTPTLDYNLDSDSDDSFRFNHASNFSQLQEDRERTTLLATLQWQPTDDLDIWFESLYSEFDIVGALPLNSFRWTNVLGSVTDSNIAPDPLGSDGLIDFLSIDGVDNRNNARTTNSNDKLTAFSLGAKYFLGDWVAEGEIAYGKSENSITSLSHEVIGRARASYDIRNNPGGIPRVEYADGFDPMNRANFRSLGFNGNLDQPTEDENLDVRLDLDRDIDLQLFDALSFNKLEFGVKYSARKKFNGYRLLGVDAETLAGLLGEAYDPNVEGGSFDASNYLTVYAPDDFLDGVSGSTAFPQTWLSADVDTLLNIVPLSTLVENGTITEGGSDEINVEEEVLAGYAKLNFEGLDGRLSGNFGVRIASTDQESRGNIADFSTVRFDQGGAATFVDTSPSSTSRSYTEVLPSFNLRYNITDDVLVRFGAARVMSRPSLSVLSPATSINVNVRTISSSNPNVDPFLADQLDLSLEWYFADGGMISVAPFAKFIDSFVVSATKQEQVTFTDLEGANPQTASFTRFLPDNGRGSDLYGLEINYQQPLDFIADGFGLIANFTVVDADDVQTAEGGPLLPLDGLSEINYNLVGYYENDIFGARLAYNYRDEFVNSGTNYFGDGSFTEEYKQLDFSSSIEVSENVSVIFEALNLTNEVLVQVNSLGVNRGVEDVGRRITMGARVKF